MVAMHKYVLKDIFTGSSTDARSHNIENGRPSGRRLKSGIERARSVNTFSNSYSIVLRASRAEQ